MSAKAKTSKNIYTILKIDWMYDDENYSKSENEGGRPIMYSTDRKAVQDECDKLNAAKLKNIVLDRYMDYFDAEELAEQQGVESDEIDVALVPKDQLPVFYEVVEVPAL